MDRVVRLAGLAALCMLASPALAPSARAASFDCAKAASATEKAICRDPALSKQDDAVAAAYKAAQTLWPAGNWPTYIRTEQRNWLRDRDRNCKGDVACLKLDYTRRLAYLQHPSLKWSGRYVSGPCPKDGIFVDVTPGYPDDGVDVEIYYCPTTQGNMLQQAEGKPNTAGRLDYKATANCPITLMFTQDTVTVSGPATGNCKLLFSERVFKRDPVRSPYLIEN